MSNEEFEQEEVREVLADVENIVPDELSALPVTGEGVIKVVIGLEEEQGQVKITGRVVEGPTPSHLQVAVYRNSLPQNPNTRIAAWEWISNLPHRTRLTWGSGWVAAASLRGPSGRHRYSYIARTNRT